MPDHSQRLWWRSAPSPRVSLAVASQMAIFVIGSLALLFHRSTWSPASDIAVVLAAVAIFMAVDRFLLYQDYHNIMQSQLSRLLGLGNPGFEHIYLGGEQVRRRILEVIEDKSVRQLLIQGRSLCSFFSDPAINAAIISALERSVFTRVLLLDPDSEQARLRSRLEAEADTRQTMQLLKALGARYGTSLDVRLYSSGPEAFVLITEKLALVQQYFLGEGEALPTCEIANPNGGGDIGNNLYRLYREHVEYLYQASKAVSLANAEPGTEDRGHWDVFLCYSSRDKRAVLQIARELEWRGISSFIGDQQIRPGIPLGSAIADVLHQVDSVVVFVGSEGTSPWQEAELRTLLTDAVQNERIVIPVFLPGVDIKNARQRLPIFLRDFSSVQFSQPADDQAIESLVWAITGKRAATSGR